MMLKDTITGGTNGMYIIGKVNGSSSGIYIKGDIGYIGKENETNTTYGIY